MEDGSGGWLVDERRKKKTRNILNRDNEMMLVAYVLADVAL